MSTGFEVHAAATLEEASTLMARFAPRARLLAGGTDLLVDLRTARVATDHLVSINRIDELRGITVDSAGIRIGALTTPNQLAASPIIRKHLPALEDATKDLAAPQVRNMATIGGNIASAIPSADLPPVLIVHGASVVLWSPDGQRSVPLESFFTGPRQSVRKDNEVLTAIEVPIPARGFGAAYERFANRNANACAVAAVAAGLLLEDNGTIRETRIVLCAVAPTPKLLASVGHALTGKTAGEATFDVAAGLAMEAAKPISDIRGSDLHRKELIGVLTRRALAKAHRRALETQ